MSKINKSMVLPKISVIMPVYNAEVYVSQAIESILNQSYKNFEFIIINDASNDKSLDIINSYKFKDKRIKIITLDNNQGIAIALNNGIAIAQGEYIVRMDADDISLPYRLDKQLNFMESNRTCGVSGSWLETIDRKGNSLDVWKGSLTHENIKSELLFNSALYHPTIIFRREIFSSIKQIYNPDFVPAEDYELWSRLSSITKLANIPEILIRYRVHDKNISYVESDKQILQANKVRNQLLKELKITPIVKQLQVHEAISSWNKFYLLNNDSSYDNWIEEITLANSLTNYTSEEAMQKLVTDYENKLKRFDSHTLAYLLDKYFGVTRYTEPNKLVMIIQKVFSVLPKKFIAKFL